MWDFVMDKVAPAQVSSEYFGFPCQIHSTNCSKKSSSSSSSSLSSSINHRGYVQQAKWANVYGRSTRA
jgi:hypothetical protein